jgi:low affinity Fe/Cu permease
MPQAGISRFRIGFEKLAQYAAIWSGSSWAFTLALLTVLIWVATGPIFAFSDTWQLVINTGTTVVTFLMVFLIQHQQNKDSLAIQIKLNELVAALRGASNRLINVENLTEAEVRELHDRYQMLAEEARQQPRCSMSIEDTQGNEAVSEEDGVAVRGDRGG